MAKDKVRLLIIDDDPKVSWALSEGLSHHFEILSARDGQEGLEIVSSQKPELILLDIKMPKMSGLEVLEKIKSIDSQLDVIMLSGHGGPQNVVGSRSRVPSRNQPSKCGESPVPAKKLSPEKFMLFPPVPASLSSRSTARPYPETC